jgi:cell filamentation protein
MSRGSDPYVYPGTDTLRNLAGIRDPQELAIFEAEATLRRSLELSQRPVHGNFDTARLIKAVHQHLFQDVYPWAGRFRTTVLAKQEFDSGPVTYFTAPHLLGHEAGRIFNALCPAPTLRDLPAHKFAREAALLLAALNMLQRHLYCYHYARPDIERPAGRPRPGCIHAANGGGSNHRWQAV